MPAVALERGFEEYAAEISSNRPEIRAEKLHEANQVGMPETGFNIEPRRRKRLENPARNACASAIEPGLTPDPDAPVRARRNDACADFAILALRGPAKEGGKPARIGMLHLEAQFATTVERSRKQGFEGRARPGHGQGGARDFERAVDFESVGRRLGTGRQAQRSRLLDASERIESEKPEERSRVIRCRGKAGAGLGHSGEVGQRPSEPKARAGKVAHAGLAYRQRAVLQRSVEAHAACDGPAIAQRANPKRDIGVKLPEGGGKDADPLPRRSLAAAGWSVRGGGGRLGFGGRARVVGVAIDIELVNAQIGAK